MGLYMFALLCCLCVKTVTMAESDADLRSVLLKLLNKVEHQKNTNTLDDKVQKDDSGDDLANNLKQLLDRMDEEIAQLELNVAEQSTGSEENEVSESEDVNKPPYLTILEKLKASADRMTKLQQGLGDKFAANPDFANEIIDEMRKIAIEIGEKRDNSSQDTRDWHSKYCAKFLQPCGGINFLCCPYGSFPGAAPFKQCCSFIHVAAGTSGNAKKYYSDKPEPTTGICLPNPYDDIPCKI